MTQHAVARLAQLDEHRPCASRPAMKSSSSSARAIRFMPTKATAPTQVPRLTGVVCGGLLVCPWHKAALPSMTGWSANPLRWLTCAATRPG